jgi:molecular chaperone DnaJ
VTKRDYYEILGVSRTAGETELKKSYRELAKKFHPDVNPGNKDAEEKFKEASEAYEVLRDPEKRKIYDAYGHEGLRGRGFSGFNNVNDIFSNFSDIFESFFGFSDPFFGGQGRGRQRRNSPVRGADISAGMTITFEESYKGCEKELDLEKYKQCSECSGSGVKPGSSPEECHTCGGYGQVRRSQGFFTIQTTCPNCRGEGQVVKDKCQSCKGAGKILERKKIKVKVPAGIDSGTSIRLAGEGEPGLRNGPAGDMYLEISVKPHDYFERIDENNILTNLEVTFVKASLGGEIEVETMDGKKKLEIPKGAQTGKVLKLGGLGFQSLRGNGKGDHLFQIFVKTPTNLNKRQKEILEEFAQLSGEEVKPLKKGKKSLFEKIKDNL